MRPTKKSAFTIIVSIGALLTAGLFLFAKKNAAPLDISQMKPSQLNLSQSNSLPNVTPVTSSTQHEKVEIILPKAQRLQNEEKVKWDILENILKTKNDNDSRMDTDLKKLTPAFREALYEKYESMAPEDRGGRGLIVFLVARDLSSIEDMEFLKKVYQEPPCLSLADCKTSAPDNPHHSSTDQTTLVYGQLSGLYVIEKQLSENPELLNDAAQRSKITQVLTAAEAFPVPAVHEKARSIRTKYGL